MSNATARPRQRPTQEIPQADWNQFLEQFTIENRGAHARLEVLMDEVGSQVEIENRPFEGASADTRSADRPTVWLMFGSTPADHLAHGVPKASAVRALSRTGTEGAVLEVEAQDGSKTLLELSLPEQYELPPGKP